MFEVYPNSADPALPITCSLAMPSSSARDEEQPRRRRKEYERERESPSSRDKERDKQHRSSAQKSSSSLKLRKRRSTSKEGERERDSARPTTTSDRSGRKVSSVVPEMERRPSGGDEPVRPKSSYPTFSKAHSREAVHKIEDIGRTKSAPYTPEATEVGGDKDRERRRRSTPANGAGAVPTRAPPSPPLTADNPEIRRSQSGGSIRKSADAANLSTGNGANGMDSTPRTAFPNKNSQSTTSLRKEARFQESDVSSMPGAFPEDERRSTPNSGYRRTVSTGSQPASAVTQDTENSDNTDNTNTDSDATSVAPDRKEKRRSRPPDITPPEDTTSPLATDTQPKTPTPVEQKFPRHTKTPVIDIGGANAYTPKSSFSLDPKTPLTAVPPPPPPPPPLITGQQPPPRVDYLLKHGGLTSMVPKRLVQMSQPVQQYAMYQSPAIGQMAPIEEYARIFGTLHKRLDDYLHVLRHNGSLAVATGYKSVARRLLDKLSQVFARDISSQRCDCVVCKTSPQPTLSDEEDTGISWGEILEFVSGRRELPQWPPFTITPDDSGLGIKGATQAPMQKLDIDVPEEYKDHYIRQNQKTKKAVQSWLAQQPEYASAPPEEADEDTLMFAMMTKLNPEQRNAFIALMHGQNSISASRAPTPAERPANSSDALRRARKALHRLYRLDRPPRDCESAMYLLNNPPLHSMLATLAEVNEQEWDILVSGRFDGFLWSGAEAPFPPSASSYAQSRGPSRGQTNATPFSRNTTPFSGMSAMPSSRNQTPFSPLRNVMSSAGGANGDTPPAQQPPPMFPSRGATPAMGPAPVQMDEDTEIAVLAEVERNLFNDMERFEDAFEILHSRAELVRQLLRERSAGLSISSQLRRGSDASAIDVRLGTPASGVTDFDIDGAGEEAEGDDGLADLASLAPDDSASQISVNRRLRKRHDRRRTPGMVVEEGEEEGAGDVGPPPLGSNRWGTPGGRRSKY